MFSKRHLLIATVVTLAAGLLIYHHQVTSNIYHNFSWEDPWEIKAGDKILIEGYLRSATSYPLSIFQNDEKYNFLSPNQEHPLEGQIPLIINEPIDCSEKVRVYGTIVIRRGPGGKDTLDPLARDWPLIRVDTWTCLDEE